jgi:hypothetical protein
MKIILIALSLSVSIHLKAGNQMEKKLFTMEKDFNRENIMQIHTQTDKDCRFIHSNKNAEENYIEFYWIMNNGKEIKEVHPLIRGEIKNRISFQGINTDRDSFKVKFNDLKELKHDLTDTTIEISSEIYGEGCHVRSLLSLGASAQYRKLDMKKTYCEVTKNIMGIPNGCKFLELSGLDAETGQPLKVRFYKK